MRLCVILLLIAAFAHALLDNPCLIAEGFTFGVIGDWGMGGYKGGYYPEIISSRRYTETCVKLGCNFTISVGDNFYCGKVSDCIRYSFEEGMKDVPGPFFPVIGNHDNVGAQIGYTSRNPKWYFPSHYYTVKLPIDDTGYTVQIFAVNGNSGDLAGGEQYEWLRRELRKSNARWKIIVGHYPTVGSGRHKRVRSVSRIHEIMTEFNAQAYFSGHDHIVEVSNLDGRALCMSGGMSRGAMMAHGIGGSARRFTLTSPGEYSPYRKPWASRGFMTVDLSPNTMNVQVWDSSGGMHYEFTVTHDWMRRVKEFPDAVRHLWPPPEVVREALRSERSLPRGPGGGTLFLANGTRIALPENTTDIPIEDTPTTKRPTTTDATTKTTTTTTTAAPAFVFWSTAVPDFVQYAVSTECAECDNTPRVNRVFTLRISGIEANATQHRIFLTKSPAGCNTATRAPLIEAGPAMLVINTVQMRLSRAVPEIYVCLSADGGASYSALQREDSIVDAYTFSVIPL